MKFEIFIARRYLTRGGKSTFISIISLVSIIGIAIGVAALIIALALMNGFQNDIRNKILNSTAHIMINSTMGTGIDDYENLSQQIRRSYPEVVSANPVVFGTVLLKGHARNASGAILRGIMRESVSGMDWLKNIESGGFPAADNEILLGRELALRMGLFAGDRCTVITPRMVLSPGGSMPAMRRMKVAGVFHSGLYEVDNTTVITPIAAAQKMLGLKNRANYIQVFLKDMFAAEALKKKMQLQFPAGLSVITWKDLNASLYTALKLEKTVLFFTLTLIIIVAALNIIAGLILMVIQKIKDIGILQAYGATARTIKRIFFIQGGIIGILGTGAGVGIGLIFTYLANRFELIRIPAELYQMSHVPFRVTWFDMLAVVAVSLLISFSATLIPAHRAASVNVVEAVKNE